VTPLAHKSTRAYISSRQRER